MGKVVYDIKLKKNCASCGRYNPNTFEDEVCKKCELETKKKHGLKRPHWTSKQSFICKPMAL